MKHIKLYTDFINENTVKAYDGNSEDAYQLAIRHFKGSVQDLDNWLRSKIGETNPYKNTKMINGPHQNEEDRSLPYQDFQNGNSDFLKNRYGR
jgi:hypothetical protein